MERVIRSVLQKESENGSFSNNSIAFAIGSEGIYTQMFSGLNLEEDLRIGGEKQTSYENKPDSFEIIEKYYCNNSDSIYYQLKINIHKDKGVFFVGEGNEPAPFLVGSNQNPFIILKEPKKQFSDNFIQVILSTVKPNNDPNSTESIEENIIKRKYITFSEIQGKKYIYESIL